MQPLAIDLFCGLGGWTEGLLLEGFRVVGFDIERHEYGDHRYPAQLVLQDVRTIHGSQFKDAALIVGSSPCQEFSYRAMPWKRAKALPPPYLGMELFNAQFRIQREACEAAGRHVPMVVENVKGAQKWVGQAKWHYGSFYLWGDVPALMPIAGAAFKNPGFRFDGRGKSFQTESVERATKNTGGSWFAHGNGATVCGNDPRYDTSAGVKGFTPNGEPLGKNTLGRKHGSKSKARKMASAMIAKIPLPLARHVAAVYYASIVERPTAHRAA